MLPWLRRSFTRETSSVAYIPQLDGLRSLALLLVLMHHVFATYVVDTHRLGAQHLPEDWNRIALQSPLVGWALNAAFGVPVFFAISGFVLALPFARAAMKGAAMPSVPMYLLRRIIRLEPPYFLFMSLMYLSIVAPWKSDAHTRWVTQFVFRPHYLASIAYVHALVYGMPSWIAGVAWTLEIEIQFYLLMPVLAFLFLWRDDAGRRLLLGLLTIGAGLFSEYVVPGLHAPRVEYSIIGHAEFFLAGILLADVSLDPPVWLKLRAAAADVLAVTGAGLLVYVLRWQARLAWAEPLLLVMMYYGVFGDGWAGRLFKQRWLTVPGTMCYTVYLYHLFVVERWMPVGIGLFKPVHGLALDVAVQLLMVLPLVLLVAAVMYLLVERPFVQLSHWVTRRWRVPPARTEVAA